MNACKDTLFYRFFNQLVKNYAKKLAILLKDRGEVVYHDGSCSADSRVILLQEHSGSVAERLNAAVLKTAGGLRPS